MQSPHVSNSTSTATGTSTTTTVAVSGASQPESTAGQRQQGSFVGLSTPVHTPESGLIPANYHQQDELRPLSDICASQIDPFKALTTYLAVTFDDDDQGQSASSLSLSNEPSRSQKSSQPPVDDVVPIVREKQRPHPIDKWIMMSGDKKRPFQCAHESCGKKYARSVLLQAHLVRHTCESEYRCYAGDYAGTNRYWDKPALARHIQSSHTFERPHQCEICKKWYRRPDNLKYHMEHMHFIKSKKKSPKPQSVSKSSSATSKSKMTSGVSQPESAAGQRQQGSFVDLSKSAHMPESTLIPEADWQFSGLRLLAEVSTSQIDPFKALATHQSVSFDDEAVTTAMAGSPNLPSFQYLAKHSPDPTDTNKWIIVDKSQERPYRCGYPECDKSYKNKRHLIRHFIVHTGVSNFGCTYPECVGKKYFRDHEMLNRHITSIHTLKKPFRCNKCNKPFARSENLKSHTERHVCMLQKMKKNLLKRKKK